MQCTIKRCEAQIFSKLLSGFAITACNVETIAITTRFKCSHTNLHALQSKSEKFGNFRSHNKKWKAARCVLFAQCELLVTVSMFVLILFCDIGQKGFDKQYRLDRHFESATHRSLAESLAIVAQQLSVESPAEVFK